MADTFSDLPDALVRDLLNAALPLGDGVKNRLNSLKNARAGVRAEAEKRSLIKRKADLDVPREPSVAGIDGSYQIHRLTSLELCASAAIAVEGTSKEAVRYWPEPYHRMWAQTVPHSQDTTGVLRGLMVCMEFDLAFEAPHDLVLMDGSFSSLIIYLNQGLANVNDVPALLGDELLTRWHEQNVFDRLVKLLRSDRSVAVPKFTSRNELVASGGLPNLDGIDGRTVATLMLNPGEYTTPLPVFLDAQGNAERYHLPHKFADSLAQDAMNDALHDARVIYYRPFGWVHAMRLEVPGTIANSQTRLSILLEGLARQFFSPAVTEPYPLFLADRMVKSLGSAVSVIEQTIAQHVVDEGVDVELAMLCLQNYRTEGGRGGV